MAKNRILVVDDDKIVLYLIEKAFGSQAVELAFAAEGEEALAKAVDFQPDLVILDIMMPGNMDGYEVCRRIKAGSKTAEAMVLLLSGKSSLESRLLGYEARADDYLIKPFDGKELVAKAWILLRLKNARDKLRSVNRNLTALVKAKTRELVRKERQAAIGEMMQGLVHNIRGPLSVAQARAQLTAADLELLAGDPPESLPVRLEDLMKNQSLIVEAVKKVEDLVVNLLAKSRSEGRQEMLRLDLNSVVRRELEFLKADPQIHRKVKCRFHGADDLPPVTGVYADFSQVVYNLVKNAADAMDGCDTRELDITTRFDDDHVYMEFVDTGTGIDPAVKDRIFDCFFSTKDKGGGEESGSGLGLFTCRQLMGGYGATITGDNAPDKGARFTVAVPRKP